MPSTNSWYNVEMCVTCQSEVEAEEPMPFQTYSAAKTLSGFYLTVAALRYYHIIKCGVIGTGAGHVGWCPIVGLIVGLMRHEDRVHRT